VINRIAQLVLDDPERVDTLVDALQDVAAEAV
jgi:hypothetical protein